MSRIATEELRRIAEAATPGLWRTGRGAFFQDGHRLTCRVYTEEPVSEMEAYGDDCIANARLIALDPQLAAEVLQLRALLHLDAAPVVDAVKQGDA